MHSILKILAHSVLMVLVHKNVMLYTLFHARVFIKVFSSFIENKLFLILLLFIHTQYGRKILEKAGVEI